MWRLGAALAVTLLLVLIALLGAGWLLFRHSLPPDFAELSSGVQDSVVVWRDSAAVPTVVARETLDAFFALGYLHAQDRLWQMDLARRIAFGRVAEILGEEAVPLDYLMRVLALGQLAQRLWDSLHPLSRAILKHYAAGVNAWLEHNSSRLPPEFLVLSYRPEPWQPVHSLAIARLMAFDLAFCFWSDIAMGSLAEEVGLERAWDLLPGYPPTAPTVLDELAAVSAPSQHGRDTLRLPPAGLMLPPLDGFHAALSGIRALRPWLRPVAGQGSNAWAVRTSQGAILANDPHLVLGLPARWYPVCILSPDYEVAGLTLPGLPLVVIGRNRTIAWGVTNLMADESDFFIERLDTARPQRYWDGTRWQRFQRRRDTIRVRGKPPVIIDVLRSQNGPIVSEAHLFAAPSFLFRQPDDTTAQPFLKRYRLSYRWAAAEGYSDEILAAYRIGQARSWSQFRAALRFWGAPVLCFVYADRNGTVAVQPAGYIPVRDSTLPERTWAFPLPGWEAAYRWRGLVNMSALPGLVNPRQGFVISANNKLARTFPLPLTTIWEPPSRAQRLAELLAQSADTYTLSTAQRMQMDVVSPYAREMMQVVLPLLEQAQWSAEQRRALHELRQWDWSFERSSIGATLYAAFLHELLQRTFGVHLSWARLREYLFLSNLALRRLLELLSEPNSPWFDDPRTERRETLQEVVRQSFAGALDTLRQRLGNRLEEWRYERLHTLRLVHPLGLHPLLRPVFSLGPYPSVGAPTTVNTGEWRLWAPFEQILGASARFIADLRDTTWAFVLPGGVSGHFLSPHYADELPLWLYGGLLRRALGVPHTARRAVVFAPLTPEPQASLQESP
ncbi:Acyl-homoserine lactone acylase QuiP [bacterium HR21]|nr:Acyl-homoserine lactone acylase QuiP [bacterium HR21]